MQGYRQKLNKNKYSKLGIGQWSACLPFVINSKAKLVHRPIAVNVHKLLGKYHISVHYACGLMASGSKKFTFTGVLDDSHVVCHRCEMKMAEKGEQSSSKINGGHVHIGGVEVVKVCNHE